jgi:hypothetical protein
LDAFLEHFRWDLRPTYVSLLCCGCSTADIAVAEISHYWNVPQVLNLLKGDRVQLSMAIILYVVCQVLDTLIDHIVNESFKINSA